MLRVTMGAVTVAAIAATRTEGAVHAASLADSGTPLRIALLADPHATRGDDAQRRPYRLHFDEVIEAVNAANVDIVLVAGDLTDDGLPEQYDDFKAQIARLKRPVRFVPGNHDTGSKRREGVPADGGTVKAERIALYEQKMGATFWAETLPGGVRLIGVDTPVLGSGLPLETKQWAFLERELGSGAKHGAPTILLLHYPLYTKAADEPSDLYWNIEPTPRKRLLDLIAATKAEVRGLFSGHLHRPLERTDGRLRIVGTAPVSYGLPMGSQPEGWTLVTVPATGPLETRFFPVAAKRSPKTES